MQSCVPKVLPTFGDPEIKKDLPTFWPVKMPLLLLPNFFFQKSIFFIFFCEKNVKIERSCQSYVDFRSFFGVDPIFGGKMGLFKMLLLLLQKTFFFKTRFFHFFCEKKNQGWTQLSLMTLVKMPLLLLPKKVLPTFGGSEI